MAIITDFSYQMAHIYTISGFTYVLGSLRLAPNNQYDASSIRRGHSFINTYLIDWKEGTSNIALLSHLQ